MPKIVEDEQIYRAVMQVVSERGYAGATTKQMADAANVSEVTLFRKYENKAELVKQAILFIVEQTDFSSAAQYTGDIHADLLRVVQAYQDSAVKHGFFFAALFSDISRYPELVEALDKPLEIFSAIQELVSRYQEEGALRQGHSTHIVTALLGPLIYTAMMRGTIPNSVLPPRNLSNYVKDFLNGYQTDPFRE
ncbi:MAG: TetR/AcrR family transcriptional regulator [Anaerolineales bacterium]